MQAFGSSLLILLSIIRSPGECLLLFLADSDNKEQRYYAIA